MVRATVGYNEGVKISEEGRWEDAVAVYTELIESNPNDTYLLARTYGSRGLELGELGGAVRGGDGSQHGGDRACAGRGEDSSEVEPFGDEWGSNLG